MKCKELKRLTTDNPKGCTESMLNNLFAENGKVKIRFTEDGRKDVDLCEYIAEKCKYHYSADDIMEWDCGDCQMCPYGTMHSACVQAAELRERLKFIEDKLENGTLIELPCKVGDTIYNIYWWKDVQKECKGNDGETYYRTERKHYVQKSTFALFDYPNFGKTVFLTKEEAKARLKECEIQK